MCKNSEEAKNASIVQKPNPSDKLSSKPYFDSESGKENSRDGKIIKKAIIAGVVLPVSSIASYILKMYIIAVLEELFAYALRCIML
ncbi:MAG: hypothetical protein ACEY3K_00035 [Wolbachia sp.]